MNKVDSILNGLVYTIVTLMIILIAYFALLILSSFPIIMIGTIALWVFYYVLSERGRI